MYRVPEILSTRERIGAIRHGMIVKLASEGIGPSKFVMMNKTAKNDLADIIDATIKLSVGAGIPLGVASYAVQRSLTPSTRTNKKLKRQLEEYNNVVAQYNNQMGGDSYVKSAGVLSGTVEGLGVGALAGGTAAAIQSMVSDYLEARRQKKLEEERRKKGVSKDTVVLYLPKEPRGTSKLASAAPVKVEPTVESREIKYDGSSQPRETNGRYSSSLDKSAVERMVDNGFWLASAAVGLPLGYGIVKKIHNKIEEKELQRQIEAAQKEYVSLLTRPTSEKTAEEFLSVIGLDPSLEKDAFSIGERVGRFAGGIVDNSSKRNGIAKGLEDIGSTGIATALLSSLATAYITNRVLHKNFDPKEDDDEDEEPSVKHVLFKQGSDKEYEITGEQVLTTIAVMRDCMEDSVPFEKFAVAFAEDDENYNGYMDAEKYAPMLGFSNAEELARFYQQNPNSVRGRLIRWKVGPEKLKKFTPENMALMRTAVNNQQNSLDQAFDKGMDPEAMKYLINAYGNETYKMGNEYTYDGFANKYKDVAGKLAGVAGSTDPAKVRGVMLQYMKSHPHEWLQTIGDKEHAGFREAAVNNYLNNSGGMMGWLSKLPVIGPWMQNIMRSYAGSANGQRMMAMKALSQMGITGDAAREILRQYNFNGQGGGWIRAYQPVQTAGQPGQQPPAQPANGAPAQPANGAPAKPAQTVPAKPAQPVPAKPAQAAPVK